MSLKMYNYPTDGAVYAAGCPGSECRLEFTFEVGGRFIDIHSALDLVKAGTVNLIGRNCDICNGGRLVNILYEFVILRVEMDSHVLPANHPIVNQVEGASGSGFSTCHKLACYERSIQKLGDKIRNALT